MKENKGRVLEVVSKNLNGGIQSVSPVAFNHKTQSIFWLDKNGVIVEGNPPPTAERFHFALTQKKKLPGDAGFQWAEKFEVQDEVPKGIPENEKKRIRLMQGVEKYLKMHPDVSFKDAAGNELNENCRSNLFEIIDEDASSIHAMSRAKEISKACLIITEAFDNDKEEFESFVYGMGLGSLMGYKSLASLSKMLLIQAEQNPSLFLDYINSPERELINILERATASDEGATPDITKDGSLYYMNGEVIAKGFDELKSYFKNNSNSFKYLSEKYGKKKEVMKSPAKSTTKPSQED